MKMLDDYDLKALLGSVTYKPGYDLTLFFPNPFEGPYLKVHTWMPDARNPDGEVELDINSPIPPMHDADAFVEWLVWRLRQIEIHETLEWFKFNDEMIYDPHKI